MTIGQLMKNLRDKGWIPRGYNEVIHTVYDKKHKIIGLYKEGKKYLELVYKKSLRQLVSKESGLWQFVCENRKYGYTIPECWIKNPKICNEGIESVEKECNQNSYEYYIIESALKDESELEQFLLDNIKVE